MAQHDTTATPSPSEYWQHYRQQQQHETLATDSLPHPLIISNVNAAYEAQDHQDHYQHRHSFSSTGSPWTLNQYPETPPSAQQEVILVNQSLYDQHQYHHHHNHPQHPSSTSTKSTSSDINTGASSLETTESTPQQQEQGKHLRFHTVLQAMTAVTKKTEISLTYLNRNQCYGIQLADKLGYDGLIHSQCTINFYDPAHQKVAHSYWKFWINQHKEPENARSLDIDLHQSIGILNVRYPSFDQITFDWHGRHGAKLFIRFHCLSTDFSRIKGIKGIPLRICMSSQIPMNDHNPLFQQNYAGSFLPNSEQDTEMNYVEQSFCKVKIFRDKGAERKYKDDAKQLGKQFEKIFHDESKKHPLWLMYKRSVPYTIFSPFSSCMSTEVSPTAVFNEKTNVFKQPQKTKGQPSTLSHYQQQHSQQCPSYAKRLITDINADMLPPPPPLVSSVTVPTQLYFSGHGSVISTCSSSSSSSSSCLKPNNDNVYSSITVTPNQQQKYDPSMVAPPLFDFLDAPNQSKNITQDSQQSFYTYYHQQKQQ